MKKNTTKYILFISLSFLVFICYINYDSFIHKEHNEDGSVSYNFFSHEESEEKEEESEEEMAFERAMGEANFPKEPAFNPSNLKGEKLRNYLKWREELEATNYKFTDYKVSIEEKNSISKYNNAFLTPTIYSYADAEITGTWEQKSILTNGWRNNNNGFRADGSTYDPVNKELFIVSYAGHLYKIDESANNNWLLRNHQKNLKGDDFNGINLPSGAFRLLHQKDNGGMEFSDDEGRTWTTANGALFQNSWNFKTLVTKTQSGRRIVAHGGRYNQGVGYDHIYISVDYGLNYIESSLNFKQSDFKVVLCKPHNSRSIYCFARRKTDSKLFIYKMSETDSDFNLLTQPSQTFGGLAEVHGALINGNTHFYISFSQKNILYSSNEGATWTQTNSNSGRDLDEMHPTQPNICFKGFTDITKSENYGASFSGNSQTVGSNYVWDLQHMKTYDEEDGTNFTFIGMDFGSYYSKNSEDWSSWVSVNRGSPIMLCYDIVSSDKHNKIYTASQDRGSQGIVDNDGGDGIYDAVKEASTDILRVELAKNESSVWFWYYYGTIGHNFIGAPDNQVVAKDFYSSWWATSMVASPNPNEDAVYVPTGNRLDKFEFNGTNIVKSLHPFDFGEPIISFSYSKLNTNNWYVGLKSGPFMYSKDGGLTFSKSTYTGTWPGVDSGHKKNKSVILASPIDANTVYFTGKNNRFLISKDAGVTFTNHTTGLSVDRIIAIDASPDGKYIFAATNNGPWVFSVDKDRWYKMTGLDVPSGLEYTDAQFIASKNVIRFSTYGSGILDFKINENLLSNKENSSHKINYIKAYPNPNNGIFKIRVPNSTQEDVMLRIYSESGKLISTKKSKLSGGNIMLNLENEASGIYFVKLQMNETSFTVKIINK